MSFNFSGGGFDFSTKIKNAKKQKEPTTDYQKRNKQEHDRRKLATCVNYFTTVCFNTEKEMEQFQNILGDKKRYYACCEIEETVQALPKAKRDWKSKVTTEIQSVEMWEELSTFEETCRNELEKSLDVLKQADTTAKFKNVYNSSFYIVFVAHDDDDLIAFLTRHKLFRYGERRLDGSKWLKDIQENQ